MEAQERTLGAEHPYTLDSVNNLAVCLKTTGQLKDAEALYRRALEGYERTLGAEHPYTLDSVNNLAVCLKTSGPAERCRSALQESFGGPGAHPRCGASFHIELSQQFGSLLLRGAS